MGGRRREEGQSEADGDGKILMGHSSFIHFREERGDMVLFRGIRPGRMQTLEETQPILRSRLKHRTFLHKRDAAHSVGTNL